MTTNELAFEAITREKNTERHRDNTDRQKIDSHSQPSLIAIQLYVTCHNYYFFPSPMLLCNSDLTIFLFFTDICIAIVLSVIVVERI